MAEQALPQPFTDEDVEAVATALFACSYGTPDDWPHVWDDERDDYRGTANVVLAVLAEKGRLLPADGEVQTDWGIRVDEPHPSRHEKRGEVMTHFPQEKVLRATEVWHGWTPVRRYRAVSPWLPVDPTPEESK